jgi:hypothetical protein
VIVNFDCAALSPVNLLAFRQRSTRSACLGFHLKNNGSEYRLLDLRLFGRTTTRRNSKRNWILKTRVPLDAILRFATLITWLAQGPVDVQVWVKGRRMVGGFLNADPNQKKYNWKKIIEIVETLISLSPSSDEICATSVTEIDSAGRDLYLMHEVVSAPSIRMEFRPFADTPQDFDSILYYSSVEVGGLVAFALVQRKIRNAIEIDGGKRQIDFDKPIIRESWIVARQTQTHQALIDADYKNHLSQIEAAGKPIDLGDIATFIRSLKQDVIE